MKQGDRIHIKMASSQQAIPNEHEVVEDTGKDLIVKDTVTGEQSTIKYYQVITDLPRCARCGRPRPQGELKAGVIFFRDRRIGRRGRSEAFCNQKTQLYCRDTPCHSHDQMAHEG